MRSPLLAVATVLAVVIPTTAFLIDPVTAEGAVDPWGPGEKRWVRAEYDFGSMLVTNPTTMTPYFTRVTGSVHYPETGAGPFPLVLLMHGRHETCSLAGEGLIGTGQLCQRNAVLTPVDSYRGYDYLAEHLASRGYVVVSVNANDINDNDAVPDYGAAERAQLLLRTADEFRNLNAAPGAAPLGAALIGRIDLTKVGLMGHSRGGEGVARAVTYNAARTDAPPHQIKAVFALAPTDFGRWKVPNVAFATLLPYCDGDVYDLEGSWMYDDARYLGATDQGTRTQILALGANHNFYNTVWTYDDANYDSWAYDDPFCGTELGSYGPGTGRFSPTDQRRHGLVFMAGFFRWTLGGEAALTGLFTGAASVPAAACPVAEASCGWRFPVSYHAGAASRLTLENTLETTVPAVNDLGGATTYTGFAVVSMCAPSSCPSQPNYATARQMTLGWDGPAVLHTAIPVAQQNVGSRFSALTLRGAVDFTDARNAPGAEQDFRIVLRDAFGASASVSVADVSDGLFYPPGIDSRKVTLNMVRVPLSAFPGVDLGRLASVDLVFDETPSGLIQLTDLQLQR